MQTVSFRVRVETIIPPSYFKTRVLRKQYCHPWKLLELTKHLFITSPRLVRSACLDGTLGKLPGPGNSSRPSISCAWGHDRCLAASAWVRPSSKQARNTRVHSYEHVSEFSHMESQKKFRRQQSLVPAACKAARQPQPHRTDGRLPRSLPRQGRPELPTGFLTTPPARR